MNWKLKAKIQNAVSLLPSSTSYAAYYWLQRRFGKLRRLNPVSRLSAGIETWERIEKYDVNPAGKVFLEVGTGRVPLVPLAYWLMGAEKTVTIDLNPYVKRELIAETLLYIRENQEAISTLFGSFMNKKRFEELLKFSGKEHFTSSEFLELCQVDYIAPGDAADTHLPEQSIDFHSSYTVYEHIPLEVLKKILEEGNRIIKDDGLFVNRIDYSDHFSHSDKSICAINFLQYDDPEWERYAGNRYMYMNRMRHDDFISLFKSVGHHIVGTELDVDERSQELLKNGSLSLDGKFRSKPEDILAVTAAWIISRKND
jgi:SAM-dependent methyltransferase